MTSFDTRYKALNEQQRKAVDTIDGPVMVVAGPGTGKTELLSMRVANILRRTDALPQNILCLTFTESGASAMRERLAGLIGTDAYKVAIHTFHSFGTEIINQNGEYFYHGAHFRPADGLSSYEILGPILEALPHDNPIAGKMNGAFTHLRDIQAAISNFKKSGLTPDEAGEILDRNEAFALWIQPYLEPAFDARLTKKSFDAIENLLSEIQKYHETPYDLVGYHPLSELVGQSLRLALDLATMDDSTKPVSAWKRTYLEKDSHGKSTLKDARRGAKLRATLGVYYSYLVAMQEHSLYDFDDMILRVVHAMEVFNELRLNLQEQYQYLLVDEFQDTNDAQMRMIWNLTNNPASASRPNIMVVGDDDQAIYRFQGATLSNILDFRQRYDDVKIVTLRDNYRSTAPILALARQVIIQGQERLENSLESVDKTLTPHSSTPEREVVLDACANESQQYNHLAKLLKSRLQTSPTKSRAVIARHHRQLAAVLPYLQENSIPVSYERQENILDSQPVIQLELIARIVDALAAQRPDEANQLMPQLLAHPAWGLKSEAVWRLSLEAHRQSLSWLEIMIGQTGMPRDIAEWIIESTMMAQHEPLEAMLDHLFGNIEQQPADTDSQDDSQSLPGGIHESFVSPLKAYFFQHDSLQKTPGEFISYLQSLQRLRQVIREYRPDNRLMLSDFIACIDLYRQLGLPIAGNSSVLESEGSVHLLTAHKSKGLEYDEVYLIDVIDTVWGDTVRSRHSLITFPSNLALAPAGDSSDERLRLFYVALTRAKERLVLLRARQSMDGRELLLAGALVGHISENTAPDSDNSSIIESLKHDWRKPLYAVSRTTAAQLLRPRLEQYKLSATHLNNFLDITRGGPELFLLHNLLRFPQTMSPNAAYGSAVHSAVYRAHAHLAATGKKRPVEDVLHDFETSLASYQLATSDEIKLQARGGEVLSTFLTKRYDSFQATQLAERSFATEIIMCGEARITGVIDLIDIDETAKTITVTDYKTGKPAISWRGRTEFEKIKLHHYRQQLMLYKLLIESSRQFAGYTVTRGIIEFVETDGRGEIVCLEHDYSRQELDEFKSLIGAVWKRIQNLDFTLTDDFEPNYKGILAFEDSLMH